jgi:hypothetical protein
VARRRRSERIFAEILAEQTRRPPDPSVSRRPGVYDTELVDAAGRTYRLVAGEVDADRTAAIMAAEPEHTMIERPDQPRSGGCLRRRRQ